MNYNEFDSRLLGLQTEDVVFENHERIDELNTRLQSRQFSDKPMQPYFTPRPTPTKYSRFPLIELRTEPTVAIKHVQTHNPSTNFNPGTRPYGFGAYLANYDDEVSLRQKFDRSKDTSVFVPHSNSELYNVRLPTESVNEDIPHPLLFQRPHIRGRELDPFVEDYIGKSPFMNSTRPKTIDYSGTRGQPGTI